MPEADTISPPTNRDPRALVVREPDMKWLDIPREDLVPTLQTSLFPGAKAASIAAVLDYCEAAGLNVMLKPVHIVPMSVKLPNGKYEYRDVVMPGINHYRTQASRTRTYMGKSEPEWGPDRELMFGDFKIVVPEWCKVTVKRLVGGHIAEFTAQEYWTENYATKGKDSTTPNAMWQKRPKGQLHKCAEAQALRMAFPELVGGETAEEMEGKVIDLEVLDERTAAPKATKSLDQFSGSGAPMTEAGELAGHNPDGPVTSEPNAGPEDAEFDEVLDSMPDMPAAALKAWKAKTANWKPGWQWLNEVMPKASQDVRQQLAVEHAALLWAVYDSDAAKKGPQSKAAQEFSERWHLIIPPVDRSNGDDHGA